MKRTIKTIDTGLQAQVDAQLLEQGAFSPLELLLDSGRLFYEDYERWSRREVDALDGVLMGSPEKIKEELEEAATYAVSIGLVRQPREFHAWHAQNPVAAEGYAPAGKPLRVSAEPQLARLIGSTFVPAQNVPQMDLFFDNAVVALTGGIVRALSTHHLQEAQRQLDRLYTQAPNHADLAAFDRLLGVLLQVSASIDDPRQAMTLLLDVAPTAKRLLGAQARDALAPAWRSLADVLAGQPFLPEEPKLHRSFVFSQAQDWAAVMTSVLSEPGWQMHAPLCMRLAQGSFYRQQRIMALTAWCHLCWRHPEQTADALEWRAQPDANVAALWRRFADSDDDAGAAGERLSAADFPAWLLLHEPGLALQLSIDLPTGATAGEEHYRCVHRWIQARRDKQNDTELTLRKAVQSGSSLLFGKLKQAIATRSL